MIRRILRHAPTALALAFLASAGPLAAQGGSGSSTVSIPLSLQLGIPQGAFAENVAVAGGAGAGVLWRVGNIIGIRTDLGFMIYGSETRRVPLGGGALGLINVDVTTTNTILGGGIGAQVGVPGRTIMPYAGGMIGFSYFTTSSSVSGTNSSNQPFASSTNLSDGTFAKTVLGGVYVPLATGKVLLDLGVRHTWNGERVRYLTRGDITEDINGNVILSPRETRADLFSITLGVTIRVGFAGR